MSVPLAWRCCIIFRLIAQWVGGVTDAGFLTSRNLVPAADVSDLKHQAASHHSRVLLAPEVIQDSPQEEVSGARVEDDVDGDGDWAERCQESMLTAA